MLESSVSASGAEFTWKYSSKGLRGLKGGVELPMSSAGI